MLLRPFTIYTPANLDETLRLFFSLENVKIQAGGTFLLNSLKLMKKRNLKTPQNVLSLRKVKELKGITSDRDTLTIRAMTTIDELFTSSHLKDNFSVLHTVCRNISTQPIRNMATVGGNLTCRYTWTEMPAAMIGLGATMHFADKDGKASSLPAEEFFKSNAKTDKLFTHVTIKRDPKSSIAYRRVKKTQYVDIPMLSILVKTHFSNDKWNDTIVSVNNCVTFAQRDSKLEGFLNSSRSSKNLGEEALAHMDNTIYDNRSDEYKKHMFQVSMKSAIEELASSRN